VHQVDEREQRQLLVAASLCGFERGPDLGERRRGLSLEGTRAEQHAQPGTTTIVAADFRERRLGQLDCDLGIVPVKVREVQEDVRPQRAGRDLVGERPEQRPCTAVVAGDRVAEPGFDQPPPALLLRVARGAFRRQLRQLCRDGRGASQCGMPRRQLERLGDLCVCAFGSECEMPSTLLRGDRDVCQTCVELPATSWPDSGHDCRRQQRMGEAHVILVRLDHTGGHRSVEPLADVLGLGADGDQCLGRRVRDERRGLEDTRDRPRQPLEPCAHEFIERSRNRERLCRTESRSVLHQEAGDLERVERIPARGVVDAAERGARQRLAQARQHEPVDGAHRERAHRESDQPVREITLERKRSRLRFEPGRDEQLDGFVCESPGGELQHRRRRGIEPLHIVDCDEHGPFRGEEPEGREQREADCSLADRRSLARVEGERHLERTPLGSRQLKEHLSDPGREQVSQRGERVRGLGRRRSAREHPIASISAELDAGPPQRRLSDPRSALEPEGEPARLVEEGADPFELGLAADDALEREPS
jgi:hypothetical protein